MKALQIFLAALFTLTLGLGIQGCSSLIGSDGPQSGDENFFEDLQLDLNAENGGYDTSDEEPGFGDPSFFSMFLEDEPAGDEWQNQPSIISMIDNPASHISYAQIRWGQLQYNPDITEATDWSGTIRVDSGGLVVMRLIGFEPDTDWIGERPLATEISVTSQTTVHCDGLLLQIIDDLPGAGEGNMLHVELGELVYSIPVDSLSGYHEVVDVDELGNQFSIHALRHFDCPNGFLAGIWKAEFSPDRGILRGGWFNWEGVLQGHYRGHWGVTEDGDSLFRGKLIDPDGNFWAMLQGHWFAHSNRHGDGDFAGRWLTPSSDIDPDVLEVEGPLWGFYKQRPHGNGHLSGRWMEWCE